MPLSADSVAARRATVTLTAITTDVDCEDGATIGTAAGSHSQDRLIDRRRTPHSGIMPESTTGRMILPSQDDVVAGLMSKFLRFQMIDHTVNTPASRLARKTRVNATLHRNPRKLW